MRKGTLRERAADSRDLSAAQPSYAQSPSLSTPAPSQRAQKDCKYLHFEVALPPTLADPYADQRPSFVSPLPRPPKLAPPSDPLVPKKAAIVDMVKGESTKEAQWGSSWLTCDVRKFDLEVLGKYVHAWFRSSRSLA